MIKGINLISYQQGEYTISKEAEDFFWQIKDEKAFVLGIVGKQKSGKSYLLNKVLLKQNGFKINKQVSNSDNGIWIYPKLINKDSQNLLLIDSQGFDAIDQSPDQQAKINLLPVLITQVLIYNTMNQIDEMTLNHLYFLIKLKEKLKFIGDKKQDLLCVVRDFSLQLKDRNGIEITEQDYLNNAFKGGDDQKRKIREIIKNHFRGLYCSTIVRPVEDEEILQDLENVQENGLRDQFKRDLFKIENLIDRILNKGLQQIKIQEVLQLIKAYCHAVNQKSQPNIRDSLSYVKKQQFQNYIKQTLSQIDKIEDEDNLLKFQRKQQQILIQDQLALDQLIQVDYFSDLKEDFLQKLADKIQLKLIQIQEQQNDDQKILEYFRRLDQNLDYNQLNNLLQEKVSQQRFEILAPQVYQLFIDNQNQQILRFKNNQQSSVFEHELLNEKVTLLQQQNQILQNEQINLKEQIIQKSQNSNTLQQQSSQQKQNLNELKLEISQLNTQLQEKLKIIDKLNQNIDQSKVQFMQQIDFLQKNLAQVQQENIQLNQQLEHSNIQIQNMENFYQEKNNKNDYISQNEQEHLIQMLNDDIDQKRQLIQNYQQILLKEGILDNDSINQIQKSQEKQRNYQNLLDINKSLKSKLQNNNFETQELAYIQEEFEKKLSQIKIDKKEQPQQYQQQKNQEIKINYELSRKQLDNIKQIACSNCNKIFNPVDFFIHNEQCKDYESLLDKRPFQKKINKIRKLIYENNNKDFMQQPSQIIDINHRQMKMQKSSQFINNDNYDHQLQIKNLKSKLNLVHNL